MADADGGRRLANGRRRVDQQPGVACTVHGGGLPAGACWRRHRAQPSARRTPAGVAWPRAWSSARSTRCATAAACEPRDLVAWLGPCIGPDAFEVGADVLEAFGVAAAPHAQQHALPLPPRADGQHRWRADLAGLARDRLHAAGVSRVSGGTWCTVTDRSRFFSFRRDGVTGRMAAAVWIGASAAADRGFGARRADGAAPARPSRTAPRPAAATPSAET